MTPVKRPYLLDQYELAVDKIVRSSEGDVRAALMALLKLNEALELELERVSAVLVDRFGADDLLRGSLH